MSLKGQIVLGLKWTTLATMTVALVSLLKISILTRFLDKSDFGLMALLTFIMGFMSLFSDMGLTTAILHFKNISKKTYSSLYWLNILVCCALYGMLYLITPYISGIYGEDELNVLIPLIGLNIIISAIGLQFKTIEIKNLVFKYISLIEIVASIVSLIFAIWLAINDYGVLALVYASLAQYIIINAFLLFLGIIKYGLLAHFRISETLPFLKIGIYQVGGQILNYFNRDLDILIIGKLFPIEVLGGYNLAKQLVYRPVQIINPIIIKVATPTLAKFQTNLNTLKQHYLKLVNIIASINVPIYVLIIIFSPTIVNILYGSNYSDINILVRILSVYMIFRAIGNPIGSLVVATGKTHLEFYWNLLNIFIMPLFIIVAAQFGIIEVAWSLVIVMLLMFIPSWKLLTYKMTKATLTEYVKAISLLNYQFFIENIKNFTSFRR